MFRSWDALVPWRGIFTLFQLRATELTGFQKQAAGNPDLLISGPIVWLPRLLVWLYYVALHRITIRIPLSPLRLTAAGQYAKIGFASSTGLGDTRAVFPRRGVMMGHLAQKRRKMWTSLH